MRGAKTKGLATLLALAALLLAGLPALAQPKEEATGDRALFLAAEKALRNHRQEQFEKLRRRLRDYPLYPYLEYEALLQRLGQADAGEVSAFLEQWKETPLAGMLRTRWLKRLARRGRWKEYLRFYRDDGNVERRCHYLRALLETGQKEKAFGQVEPLWLHGRSRPKACDPVFKAWRQAGRLTPELVWKRFELAMNLGQVRLARYLRKLLPQKERPWAGLWLALRSHPEKALRDPRLRRSHPMREAMLRYAALRKARQEPLEALEFWRKIRGRYHLEESRHPRLLQRLASRLLREEDPAAWRFYLELEPAPGETRLQEKRILAALYRRQWEHSLAWIGELPRERQQEERWRYWKARSLEQLGRRGEAEPIYRELAGERSFYGFLAADHLGAPYNLEGRPLAVNPALLEKVAALPGVRRARELLALERWSDARREWRMVTRRLDREEQKAAARLAHAWEWHDQAIFTLARTGYWEDLELRFPLEHAGTVKKRAGERNLDISWVFGVIRQESAFNPTVRSHAGALGLMQLMPATARYVARKLLKEKHTPTRKELTRPEVNIRLGTTYLSNMLERLEQNPVLATAAYNAGPHRVFAWLPDSQLPADVWIELIPFRETRRYVQRVFTYAVIYDHRRKAEITRLSQRLLPVSGSSPQRTAQERKEGNATL